MKCFLILAPRILNSSDLDLIIRTPERIWQQVAVYEGNAEEQSRKIAELAKDFAENAIGQEYISWCKIIGVSACTASVLLIRKLVSR